MKATFWALMGSAALTLLPLSGHALKLPSPDIPDGGIQMGTGAGFHSPNSPFAALQERADILPWSLLTSTKTKVEKNKVLPDFNSSVLSLDKKSQRIQGFMMPLDPGEKQKHFLLSSVPVTCSFCVPGGPESRVEVKTKTPVKYSLGVVVIEGQFSVLTDDPSGLFYRVTDAKEIK
jgi:uncharacterized protein